MAAHTCETCGLLHDAPQLDNRESEAVLLARIEADTRLAIARLEASATRHVADVQAEAAADIADTEADAEVDAAVAEAEIIGAAIEASDQDPAEILLPDPEPEPVEEDPEDAPPPVDEDHQPHEPRKARGLGLW